MDISPDFTNFIEQFKTDHVHGASHLVSTLLSALHKELEGRNQNDQKKIIAWTCGESKGAHKDMIEMANIYQRLLQQPSLDTVTYQEECYRNVKTSIADLATRWLLDHGVQSILTLSHSSLVEETLVNWVKTCLKDHSGPERDICLHVHVLESRPKLEGRVLLKRISSRLSNEVRSSILQLHLWADSAAGLASSKVDCAVLGADRIFKDYGMLNKIGSLPVAILARAFSIPVMVVASSFKFDHSSTTPDLTSSTVFDQQLHEASELLPPDEEITCAVDNYYFETIPPDYLSILVQENGILKLS
ncbi:MAG: hypothetical protein ACFFD4_07290 [Candidatus Odinarchaeota archaeon]